MQIQIIKEPISMDRIKEIMKEYAGDFVKAAVDVRQEIMAAGGEFHADEELLLMEQEGSKREFVWGINLWPGGKGENFIEFDSMINLKPSFGNRTRGVEDAKTREKVKEIVKKLIKI